MQARIATPELFAPYGVLIPPGNPVAHNEGRGTRRAFPARLDHDPRASRLDISTTVIVPSALPVRISLIERHSLSAQAFLPMSDARLLVAAAPSAPDGSPLFDAVEAFIVPAGVGIEYRPGVWHAPLVALERPAHLAMIMWVCDGPLDCEEVALPAPLDIVLRAES
ncbi:ureidoglycolate lyase [Ancylobacter terrae]|uniref:ureidoglycolate lyase n=1 Tax=Ancylobacter sp. sgz301288 TaxID=3342077 RepID=UPI0038582E78